MLHITIIILQVIVVGVFLYDFFIIGYIPTLLGIWPKLSDICDDIIFEDKLQLLCTRMKTNLTGKNEYDQLNFNRGFSSLILTPTKFIVRRNRLSYLTFFSENLLINYYIEKTKYGYYLTIFIDTGKTDFIRFRTDEIERWILAFKQINLKERLVEE